MTKTAVVHQKLAGKLVPSPYNRAKKGAVSKKKCLPKSSNMAHSFGINHHHCHHRNHHQLLIARLISRPLSVAVVPVHPSVQVVRNESRKLSVGEKERNGGKNSQIFFVPGCLLPPSLVCRLVYHQWWTDW